MGGKSTEAKTQHMVRYADYVELQHKEFLNLHLVKRNLLLDTSPFTEVEPLKTEELFWGTGFALTGFTSLYENWSTQMWDVDVNVLYNNIRNDTVSGNIAGELSAIEARLVENDMLASSIPRFEAGMKDINSAMISSFIIGRAIIEDAYVKAMAKFNAELRFTLLPLALKRWETQLEWRKSVVSSEQELMLFYLEASIDQLDHDSDIAVRHALWPFTVLDYERSALGALTGAARMEQHSAGAEPSKLQKIGGGGISGAISGAIIGSSIPVIGTAVGAVIGAVLGLAGGAAS